MAINKVIYDGKILMDVTEDTVTPETLANGITAHGASGEEIVGMMQTVTAEEWQNVVNTANNASDKVDDLEGRMDSGEFKGENGADGERGYGILKVTTAPTAYTTATGGFTPAYRIALSTVKTQAKVDKVLVGDTLAYSYYQYPIGYVDSSYVYVGTRVSIRGGTGVAATVEIGSVTTGAPGTPASVENSGTTAAAVFDFVIPQGLPGINGTPGKDGVTPVKGVDYYTEADKGEFQAYIASELAKRGQLAPEYAESMEWLEANGDQSKMYVLPDGFIYAYIYTEATGPSYTNLSETVHENYRMGSGGTLSALAGAVTTDFIPVKKGQTVRFKGFNPLVMPSSKYPYICFYTGASESKVVTKGQIWGRLDWLNTAGQLPQNNGVYSYLAFLDGQSAGSTTAKSEQHVAADSITHIRMCGSIIQGETVVVTVDEEITEGGSAGGYSWQNTGHAFVPADYEAEINKKANKTDIPTALKNPNALTINGTAYDGSKAVEVNISSSGNILEGKKWVACGDSFTAGGYNASDGFAESVYKYTDGRFAGQNIVYPFIIGLRNNMEIVNLATGGQTMGTSDNSFMTRYANIDTDADYITIALGINDRIQSIPVGTISDNTNTTFCGAYNIALKHIIENHPFAHIGLIAINGTNEEFMQATRDIAEWWGLPCLDFGSNEVPLFNRYTGRNVNPEVVKIRERNFCVISDGITPTNAHPNTAAHEYESTFIENWLRSL